MKLLNQIVSHGMKIYRRDFLLFLGATAGTITFGSCGKNSVIKSDAVKAANPIPQLNFQPIKGPMPLITDMKSGKQEENYRTYQISDDLVIPEGFTYDIIGSWGDRIGDSRFGYNNDYLSFIETSPNEGFLTINFEYISAKPWLQSYPKVIGKDLKFAEIEATLKSTGEKGINALSLPETEPTKNLIKTLAEEALIDLGIGVISLKRNPEGKWERTYSKQDRRITGISGLSDNRHLKATGPSVAIFTKKGKGYNDNLGDKIIGTMNNCAGGTTPWGTVFSAEENFQSNVPEAVYPDGTSFDPSQQKFYIDEEEIGGLGNIFGLAGNKYGWMVEIDPANPNDYGTKHTWLGRYRHEAVAIQALAGKPLVFYSGCDRRGGHLYKFISQNKITNPTDKANSQLLNEGMLYAAKFNSDGTGIWIPLKPETPVNPDPPSVHIGGMITLPKRPEGGSIAVKSDAEINTFKQQFKTLADLYEGNPTEKQGAILIDAHLAANAAGATCTARPEDTEIAPNGDLLIAFTSGSESKSDGGPDSRIFKGGDGQAFEYGWIVTLTENDTQPDALTFHWQVFATGGEPAQGGQGFANPDNLLIDKNANLWMVSDISTDKLNKAVLPGRVDKEGKPLSQSNLRGLFGNNSIWFLPTSGEKAGNAYLFGMGPNECETTGPFFTNDGKTLFLAVQHPGEVHGIRQDLAAESRQYAMQTTDGKEFIQTRTVPLGSNWPGKGLKDPPKPSVVAIRRINSQAIV